MKGLEWIGRGLDTNSATSITTPALIPVLEPEYKIKAMNKPTWHSRIIIVYAFIMTILKILFTIKPNNDQSKNRPTSFDAAKNLFHNTI